MKTYLPFLFSVVLCIGCKPKIEIFLLGPSEFCGCTDVFVDYKITGATSGEFITDPPVSDLSLVVLDNRTTASFHICQSTNFTLTAYNDHGDVSASGVSTLVDPLPPLTMAMVPCSGGPGVWVSFTDPLHPPVVNSEVITLEFISDRPGTLSYERRSAPVVVGRNVYSIFEGVHINNVFEFRAALQPNETCTPSTTSPDGRVNPPTFNITMTMRCSAGV